MAQEIIARGKLDIAEGAWLIHDERTGLRLLHSLLHPHVGQAITISLEEPEKELDALIDERLTRVLTGA